MKRSYRISEKSFARTRTYQQLLRQYQAIPRIIKIPLVIVLLVPVVKDLERRLQYDQDYVVKQYPTDFTALSNPRQEALWHVAQPIRQQNGTHIDDRYVFMRQLGKGQEGSEALYVDLASGEVVVVKTYYGIARNDIPAHLASDFVDFSSKWQTEIEVGLLLGNWMAGNETSFVPVRDYFVLQDEGEGWHWTLVTPFIEAGTLMNLASSTKVHERTPQKLDKVFRPMFNSLLESLRLLHSAGYCHDDVKPENIFIADTKHWLIGDLGNVRHFGHPWHLTRRWKEPKGENQWADCELNDLRKMLKSYMAFLRGACQDPAAFDQAFYAESQAWSMLYWSFMRKPASAGAVLEMSKMLDSVYEPEWKA